MYPLTIGLAIENREIYEQVQNCLADLPFRVIVEQQEVGDLSAFVERIDRMRPDVLLIDISNLKPTLEEAVPMLRAVTSDCMIVALHPSADAGIILTSLRAGVNEYLFPPLHETLRKTLEKRSAERGRRRDGSKSGGKSLGFFSSKGGCGATTLICHVAVELGRQNQKVLLADLDLDAGMISFLTKTKGTYSILDAVANLHRLDSSYWRALVTNGIPGVEIIGSPVSLASRQTPRDEQLRHVLAFVRPFYDWTLVDLGRSLSRTSMAALEEIDEACLVTTLEVPALHQAKLIVQTLLDSGFGKNRIRLVLNRVPKRLDITPGELEKMLGIPISFMVPNDYPELYESYAEGRLLNRTSHLGKEMVRLASKLTGLEEEKAKKGKFALFGL